MNEDEIIDTVAKLIEAATSDDEKAVAKLAAKICLCLLLDVHRIAKSLETIAGKART